MHLPVLNSYRGTHLVQSNTIESGHRRTNGGRQVATGGRQTCKAVQEVIQDWDNVYTQFL